MSEARLFWAAASLLAPLAFGGPTLLSRLLVERARSLADNAVWRALDAAHAGDAALARQETSRALVPPLERREIWDVAPRLGLLPDVERSRLALATELLRLGLLAESRRAAWAAVRAYHAEPRPALDPRPWRVLRDASRGSDAPEGNALHLEALLSGRRPDTVDPGPGPRREIALDVRKLALTSNGYALSGTLRRTAVAVELEDTATARTTFAIGEPTTSLRLLATGTTVLGIPPILLVSLDGGEPSLLLAEGDGPRVLEAPVRLCPGTHQLTIELLNGFRKRDGVRRSVTLRGLALVPAG